MQLLDLQKSLVFFSASLTANKAVIQKVSNHAVKATDDERSLLDDVLLETEQALYMCSVYLI
jgi:magnesium transporter